MCGPCRSTSHSARRRPVRLARMAALSSRKGSASDDDPGLGGVGSTCIDDHLACGACRRPPGAQATVQVFRNCPWGGVHLPPGGNVEAALHGSCDETPRSAPRGGPA